MFKNKQLDNIIKIQQLENNSTIFGTKSIYLAIDLNYHNLICFCKNKKYFDDISTFEFISYIIKKRNRNHFIPLFFNSKLAIHKKLLLIEQTVKYNNFEAFVLLLISLTPYLINDDTFLIFEYLMRELYTSPYFFVFFIKSFLDIGYKYIKKKPRSIFSISINNLF